VRFVTNKWDLFRHVRAHRRRVFRLGWSLRAGLTRRERAALWLTLVLHDLEKYLVIGGLWRTYGVGIPAPDDAVSFWRRMNRLGALMSGWVPKYPRVQDIERLADVVDRNSDPVAMEEFGLKRQRPLSDFLPRRLLLRAAYLKREWPVLTADLQYPLSPR
jgi:hypothetical protein